MSEIALYMHAGSGNHGCEAIVRSLLRGLEKELPADEKITLVTNDAAEDRRYIDDPRADIVEEQHIDRNVLVHTAWYAYRKLTKDRESFLRYRFAPIAGGKRHPERVPKTAVSIGGDNYCYPSMVEDLMLANSMLCRQGTRTMLLGCSVEPALLAENKALQEDMKRYSRIIAREMRTYESLKKAGVSEEKLLLLPDPAFALPVSEKPVPNWLTERPTVGINLSPMVEDYAAGNGTALECFRVLIAHILDSSEEQVALIPHVVWNRSNDQIPLRKLMEEFKDTGRVFYVEDRNAEELKACIAACTRFVGARTHATIAAYSTCVPTLVVGYSVKATGIAEELFGTADRYVLPVQNLEGAGQLIEGYEWLRENEDNVRDHLKKNIPGIIEKSAQNAQEILRLNKEN